MHGTDVNDRLTFSKVPKLKTETKCDFFDDLEENTYFQIITQTLKIKILSQDLYSKCLISFVFQTPYFYNYFTKDDEFKELC